MVVRKCNCGEPIHFGIVTIGKTSNTFDKERPEHIHWFNCPACRTTFIVFSAHAEGPTPEEFEAREKELAEN